MSLPRVDAGVLVVDKGAGVTSFDAEAHTSALRELEKTLGATLV